MNERIRQLAQEAGMYVDLNDNPWPRWMSGEECELAYKKFAELIVRECLEISQIGSITEEKIKRHFGVEE